MARTFETLRDKIVVNLQTITDIQEVNTSPTLEFDAYPSVAVYPTTQESDYETTTQNERIYSFMVSVFHETKTTSKGDALIAMYDVVDQVLDNFDKDPTLTGISLPTGKQIIDIVPTTSEWGQVEDRELLEIDVVLGVRISVSIV